MKLEEFIDSLAESFDSPLPIIWSKTGSEFVGKFKLNDSNYEIKIKEYNLSDHVNLENYIAVELSFIVFDIKGDHSYSAKLDSSLKDAMQVLSTVYNGAIEKYKTEKYDLMYFMAKKNEPAYEKRRSLYDRISSIAGKSELLTISKREIKQGTVYGMQKEGPRKIDFDTILDKILK